jgi:hypothetical protein
MTHLDRLLGIETERRLLVSIKRNLLRTALALVLLIPLSALAQDQTPTVQATKKSQTLRRQISMKPRIFLGGFVLAGDSSNFSGTLEAANPTCVLTVATTAHMVSNGVGPNGSFLLNGAGECPGSFELFLSNADSGAGAFAFPTAGGIRSNTGVYSGTFAIIDATDQKTVVWAGTYTQVYNINPDGFGCGGVDFCANLGPAFGDETFNGSGLSFLLELNGFTWNAPGK